MLPLFEVDSLYNQAPGQSILCFDVLLGPTETAFGVKINAQDDEKSPFLVELNNILQLVCERIFHLWLQPDWLYKFFPQYRKHESSLNVLHGFTNDVSFHF
jgi:hypothetical protein